METNEIARCCLGCTALTSHLRVPSLAAIHRDLGHFPTEEEVMFYAQCRDHQDCSLPGRSYPLHLVLRIVRARAERERLIALHKTPRIVARRWFTRLTAIFRAA